MVSTPLRILIVASGGIAVVKIPALISLYKKAGAEVRLVMTENASRFISTLTFEALTNHPVHDRMYAGSESFDHITIRDWADLVVIAPATANLMAKIANGIADDLASTVACGAAAKNQRRFICPAMNDALWLSPATQRNSQTLAADGWEILGPGVGPLACGDLGPGRMLEPEEIFDLTLNQKRRPGRIVITAGATRQPIDAVRFISNHSSGRMGVELAREALKHFSEVVLIHGHLAVRVPDGVIARPALTAEAMLGSLREELESAEALVMAAAVADFTPRTVHREKLKKAGRTELRIECEPAPDLLFETRTRRRELGICTIGFALEDQALEAEARRKLQEKELDGIVANPLGESGAGFGVETNRAVYFNSQGESETWPLMTKQEMAGLILTRVIDVLTSRG